MDGSKHLSSLIIVTLVLGLIGGETSAQADERAPGYAWTRLWGWLKTEAYISAIDPDRYERLGMDPTRPEISPLRIGKTLKTLNPTYDYDFPRLERVEGQLRHVDRRRALAAWFDRVTAGAATPTEQHLCLTRFLSRALIHHQIQPVYPDRSGVYDPLVLLELGEARCGQVARMGIDLFSAVGYRARLVQIAHHQLAEVYYEGQWHYFDADTHANGRSLRDPDGTIPSIAALSREPTRIDRLLPYWEPDFRNLLMVHSCPYTSYYFFNLQRYSTPPQVVYKTASWEEQQAGRYFGWLKYNRIELDDERQMSAVPLRYLPSAPLWRDVEIESLGGGVRRVTLRWSAPRDRDCDLIGYRVFLSSTSRGWCYHNHRIRDNVRPYIDTQQRWSAEMYPRRFALPPADLARVETNRLLVTIELDATTPLYATVMPYDAHGEAVGRELYPQSDEVRIPALESTRPDGPHPGGPLAQRGIVPETQIR